jgi:hypothetical protein
MNEIMKTLTIIATIFLPLSFIAGVYGMNFNPQASPRNMPELNWRYGYFYSLALMAIVAAAMLWLFKRRGWLGRMVGQIDGDSRRGDFTPPPAPLRPGEGRNPIARLPQVEEKK